MSVWLKSVTHSWAETAEMLLAPEEVVIWHARPDRTRRDARLGDLVLFRLDDRSRDIVDRDTGKAVAAVRRMRERMKRPERSAEMLLVDMEANGLTETVDVLRPYAQSL